MKKREKAAFLLIGVLILIIIFLSKCESEGPTPQLVRTDTVEVYIKGIADTVTVELERVVYVDATPAVSSSSVDSLGDTVGIYTTFFSDSLVYGSIESKVKGTLLNTRFEYTPKFPAYILRVDTVKKTITNEVTSPQRHFYAGAVVGAGLQPSIAYKTKKNQLFTAGFDVVNNTVNVGVFMVLK